MRPHRTRLKDSRRIADSPCMHRGGTRLRRRVNTLAIGLYASRELWLTMFFYVLFWMNAPLGFRRWRREFSRSTAAALASA